MISLVWNHRGYLTDFAQFERVSDIPIAIKFSGLRSRMLQKKTKTCPDCFLPQDEYFLKNGDFEKYGYEWAKTCHFWCEIIRVTLSILLYLKCVNKTCSIDLQMGNPFKKFKRQWKDNGNEKTKDTSWSFFALGWTNSETFFLEYNYEWAKIWYFGVK